MKKIISVLLSLLIIFSCVPNFTNEVNAIDIENYIDMTLTGIGDNINFTSPLSNLNVYYYGDTYNKEDYTTGVNYKIIKSDDTILSNDELPSYTYDKNQSFKLEIIISQPDISKTTDRLSGSSFLSGTTLPINIQGVTDWIVEGTYKTYQGDLTITLEFSTILTINFVNNGAGNGVTYSKASDIIKLGEDFDLPECNYSNFIYNFIGYSLESTSDPIRDTKLLASEYMPYVTNNALNLYAQFNTVEVIQQPSAENNYTVGTNISPLDSNGTVSYQWYKKNSSEPIDININFNGQTDLIPSALGNRTAPIFKDASEKYFIEAENKHNQFDGKNYTYFSDGIPSYVYARGDTWNQTYDLGVYIIGEDLTSKDTILITYDKEVNVGLTQVSGAQYKTSQYMSINTDNGYNYCNINVYETEDPDKEAKVINVQIVKGDIKLDSETGASLITREPGEYYCTVSGKWDTQSDTVTIQSTPTTSHKKKYTSKEINKTESIDSKTGEKKEEAVITGGGKKGSKVTIKLPENRRVLEIIVKDKKDNNIELTKEEDGTLTFIQPASNVNIEIKYIKKEIKLTIGSKVAQVDETKSNLDVAPKIKNDRTMLPIRFIAESLDANVNWDEKNPNLVTIEKGNKKVEITIGSNKAKINGKEVELDVAAFAENDRTYLPVRFVSEALDAVVRWDESKPSEVLIYDVE